MVLKYRSTYLTLNGSCGLPIVFKESLNVLWNAAAATAAAAWDVILPSLEAPMNWPAGADSERAQALHLVHGSPYSALPSRHARHEGSTTLMVWPPGLPSLSHVSHTAPWTWGSARSACSSVFKPTASLQLPQAKMTTASSTGLIQRQHILVLPGQVRCRVYGHL